MWIERDGVVVNLHQIKAIEKINLITPTLKQHKIFFDDQAWNFHEDIEARDEIYNWIIEKIETKIEVLV